MYPAMTADRNDLYADLGLTSRATQEQIRRAYRTLVRHNHPDTRPFGEPADSAVSDTTLQQVISAYSILGDPARRALYDHRITSTRAATPIRIRTAPRFQQASPDRPPILAGPVRWHSSRDCLPNGVSGLTRRQVSAGRLVTDDRDNHGHERDAQGCEEEDVVVDGVGP